MGYHVYFILHRNTVNIHVRNILKLQGTPQILNKGINKFCISKGGGWTDVAVYKPQHGVTVTLTCESAIV